MAFDAAVRGRGRAKVLKIFATIFWKNWRQTVVNKLKRERQIRKIKINRECEKKTEKKT